MVAGIGIVALFALQRESVVGIAPEAQIDHWHDAYLFNHCGSDLPASTNSTDPDGIHTHGAGLIHVHPFNPSTAGPNATFGAFIEAIGGELTDSAYLPGPGEVPLPLLESEGCDGEDAVLQLAYWEDAFSDDDPVIVTENLAGFGFDAAQGSAYTLALLPAGAEVPKPPADRLAALAEHG